MDRSAVFITKVISFSCSAVAAKRDNGNPSLSAFCFKCQADEGIGMSHLNCVYVNCAGPPVKYFMMA